MTTTTVDRLFAAFLLALGIYVVWNALGYGYMRDTTPGPGFFPFWVGLAIVGLSIANLLRSFRGAESSNPSSTQPASTGRSPSSA